MDHDVDVVSPRSRPKRTWKEVVDADTRNMKTEDAV